MKSNGGQEHSFHLDVWWQAFLVFLRIGHIWFSLGAIVGIGAKAVVKEAGRPEGSHGLLTF